MTRGGWTSALTLSLALAVVALMVASCGGGSEHWKSLGPVDVPNEGLTCATARSPDDTMERTICRNSTGLVSCWEFEGALSSEYVFDETCKAAREAVENAGDLPSSGD